MLGAIIAGAAARFGDRDAFVESNGRRCTYAELDQRSAAMADTFRGRGIERNSVVALTLRSGIDYAVTYLAAARLGAISAGVNPSLAPPERAAILERLRPDLVVDDTAMTGTETGGTGPSGVVADHHADAHGDPDQIVAVVFTSGTTGPPKGAIFRTRQLRAICEIDLGPSWYDVWGTGTPMLVSTQFAHVGFMTKLPWYLHAGMTMHVLGRWTASDVLATIARERIPTLGAVAPQLALMLRHPDFDSFDLSCVSHIIAGGAASPPGLVRAARERFGAQYSIRYSSTESGGVGLGTAFDAADDEACYTIGRPRPGVEVRIAGSDGTDRSIGDVGDVGELCLRSAAVFDGYWNDPDATATTLVEGWLHTGDLGSIGADGLVRLAGRSKEMYIRGGYNVAPAEVEAVLSEHPAVDSIAIAQRPDDVMGEIGVAVVIVAAGHDAPNLNDLREFAADRLARWKLPEALLVVDALPLTAMQKLDRRALGSLVARSDDRSHRMGEGDDRER